MKRIVTLIIVVMAALVLLNASAYTVSEKDQVIITQFGKPKRAVVDPGLRFRIPFVQEVNRLEKRLLPWDGSPENIPTRDKKRIFVDVWARWRIVEPMQFFRAMRTVQGGQKILDNLIDAAVRDVVSRYNLIEAVRTTNEPLIYESEEFQDEQQDRQERITVGRGKMEEEMLAAVNAKDLAATYGIEVSDVHIKRVNYIDNVRAQVYERMKSERQRIASLLESEAEEERNRILGATRKELDQIEGQMEQESAEIRGTADAAVIKIYADAIGQDLEFFEFLRRLEAYKKTLRSGTRLVLSTDNEFLNLLRGDTPTN